MQVSFFKILSVLGSFLTLVQKVVEDNKITATDLIYVAEFLRDEFELPVELDLNEFNEISAAKLGTDG